MERIQKYFSSITTWLPETYLSSTWFFLRVALSFCATRNFVVKFCLQYTSHNQNSCAWEIYMWSNLVLYLNVFYSYNYFYKYNVLEMSIPSGSCWLNHIEQRQEKNRCRLSPKNKTSVHSYVKSQFTWRLFQQGNHKRAYGSCLSACREDGIYLFRCNKRRYASCPKCFLPCLKPVL